MLDRFLKLIVLLTLLLFLLQAVIGVLCRVLESALMGTASTIGHAASFLGTLLVVVAMAFFLVGLLVRGVQIISTRDPRVAREHASRERAMRQRVRRPAEGAPPMNSYREQLDDPDPAIGEEDEDI